MTTHRITNIKFSFAAANEIKKFSSDHAIFSSYVKCQNLIIKTKFGVFSLLSGNRFNINCTGVDNVEKIKKAVYFFAKISNQNLQNFHKYRIDCIAVRVQLQPNLKTKFLSKISSNFKIVDCCRFPGLILKYQDKKIKISISYFNRKGCAIVTGLKCINDMNKVINLLKSDFEF